MPTPLIIDSHAHFWKEPPPSATRLGAYHAAIEVEEFVRHMDEAGVDKLVQITRGMMGFDNSYSIEGARRYPDRIKVMVRFDAGAPDMIGRLEAVKANPSVVGIRLMTIFPDEQDRFKDGSLERMWPEAERLGIPIAIYAPDDANLIERIASRHPGLTLIVDHIGMDVRSIFKATPPTTDWPNLLRLQRHPNVYIKASAIPEAMVERPPFTRSEEKVKALYEHFGPDRLIWGSNYPPTTQVCSYREAVGLIKDGCDFLSGQDKAKILGLNATTALGLVWP